MTEEEQAVGFVDYARSLIGRARWRHMGRQPWAVDCGGLIVVAGQYGAGVRIETLKFRYGREPFADRLRITCRMTFGAPIESGAWRSGCIALLRCRESAPRHLGIIAEHPDGGLSLVHAHNLHGVVEQGLRGHLLSEVIEAYWPWPATEW